MTGIDRAQIEQTLTSALATMPSRDGLARLDERVHGAIAAPTTSQRFRRLMPSPRLGIVVAVLLIVAVTAAAGGVTLIDRLMTKSDWTDKAWARSEPIGLSSTLGGQTVTVERGYMDANRIIIGMTVEGKADVAATLRVNGRLAEGMFAIGKSRRGRSVDGHAFLTPPGIGEQARLQLEVRARAFPGQDSGSLGGPWRFDFELPNSGGLAWAGTQTARASGVSVTLDELVVSPTTVRGHLLFDGTRIHSIKDNWGPIGAVIRGKKRTKLNLGKPTPGVQGFSFFTADGFDAKRGTWTVRIDRLVADGDTDIGQQMLRIKGPWVFEVDLGN